MIQDIKPHKLNNQYEPGTAAGPDDTVYSFTGGDLLVKATEDGVVFPVVSLFGKPEELPLRFLFRIDGKACFLLSEKPEILPEGFSYVNLRSLRGDKGLSLEDAFCAYTAKHLSDWYRDTAFCGRCGTPAVHSGKERAMVCPACGNTAYPRIMPAVIVGVTNGDRLLLTRYRTGFRHNALVAGFTEIGETLEETVAREVYEEAGIRVKNIRYYKSQPWGIANDILAGFYCDVDGEGAITMDPGELSYAEWVKREEIELQPDSYSLTNEMMKRFKEGKEV